MRILLACNAGASTAILVEKMKEAAAVKGETDKIWATDFSSVRYELGNFDVLLLGPQISQKLKLATQMLEGKVPVAVIKPMDYGRLRGAEILEFARELVKQHNSND